MQKYKNKITLVKNGRGVFDLDPFKGCYYGMLLDKKFDSLQRELLDNENVINNILRMPKSHKLVKDGIIDVEKVDFLGSSVYASVNNKDTYFGYCSGCKEKCGLGKLNDN